MDWDYAVAAAIDFGTHSSGYAWTPVSNEDRELSQRKIFLPDEWPDGKGSRYPKTSSAVLLDSDDRTVAWGHTARQEWRELGSLGERQGYKFSSSFKMALAPKQYGGAAVPGLSTLDVSSPRKARPLITAYLRELYQVALSDIMKSGYRPHQIRWCLTVPAIWDEEQKDLMSSIAADAGMPADDRLLLAIEPEVAALHCQVHLATVYRAQGKRLDVTRGGNRFMVVDCGGGTVDITSYLAHTGPDGTTRLSYITEPSGNRLGSEFINKAFMRDILTDRLGTETVNRLHTELFELVDKWESFKTEADCEVDPDSGLPRFKRGARLDLGAELYAALDSQARRRLAEQPGGSPTRIVLSAAEVKHLFDGVVDPILELIDTQLQAIRDSAGAPSEPEHILVVGGMARSHYFINRIGQHVGPRAEVLVPKDPAAAVLLGAVHFSYDPSLIRARQAKYTYGCETAMAFEEDLDSEHREIEDGHGRKMCWGRFRTFVTRGETVDVDRTVTHTFSPMKRDASTITFSIYRTREKNPRYVDEPHCGKLVDVVIDISDSLAMPYEKRTVALRMRFGETKVGIEAFNPHTGRSESASVRFEGVY